jgi:hypothetical protein
MVERRLAIPPEHRPDPAAPSCNLVVGVRAEDNQEPEQVDIPGDNPPQGIPEEMDWVGGNPARRMVRRAAGVEPVDTALVDTAVVDTRVQTAQPGHPPSPARPALLAAERCLLVVLGSPKVVAPKQFERP